MCGLIHTLTMPKAKPNQRNWCFTDFELLDWASIYAQYEDIIRYVCWGKEICPKTKAEHLQGWIQFTSKKRMTAIKKVVQSKKLHLEPCFSGEAENDKYCRKDNNFECRGKYIGQGARTDIEVAIKLIKAGKSMAEIADANPQLYIQYHNGLSKYKNLVDGQSRKKFRHVEVILLQGPTNCGKTRLAMESDPYKIQGCALQWWDGYDGEETILIDEYANDVKITELLGYLDGYHLRLPIKGGFVYANWSKVYITTNLEILHENAKDAHRAALDRRITTVKSWFKKVVQGTP